MLYYVLCVCYSLYGEAIPGWDCGDEAAAWFSMYLKEGHRLLYNPGIQLRSTEHAPFAGIYVNSSNSDDKVSIALLTL